MENKAIDISLPKRCYYSDSFSRNCCPECESDLTVKSCTILVVVKSSIDDTQYATNLNGSKFCHKCPVVVFNKDLVELGAKNCLPNAPNVRHSIVGIIDIDSIPKEKQYFELGSNENPMPLVRFLPNLNFTEPNR